jgi:hypothetical protein
MKIAASLCSLAIVVSAGGATHAAVDFKKEILPLIEGHCWKCHRAPHEENGKMVKPKGDLRLDAAWVLLKGNVDVVPVVPKDIKGSAIVAVVTLPRDDDMAMPPDGKGDPLTAAEIAKLKTWITEGADFGGWEGNTAGKPAEATTAAKAPVKVREHDLLYAKLAHGLDQPASDVLKQAQSTGAQIAPVAPDSPLLRVDFLTGVSKCDDNAVAALAPIAERIAHLDLARTNITDAAFQSIIRMPRLTRLDLRKTKVTDAGIAQLAVLKNLVSINLFGTEVTDKALGTLAEIQSLKEICLFETKVTDVGVNKLKAALPGAGIVFHLDSTNAGGKPKAAKNPN